MAVVGYSLKYMHFQWIRLASVACFRGVLQGAVMLLFCQFLMLGFAVPYCKASSQERAILILYSNEYELPANQLISSGLQKGLRDAAKVVTFTEFLDATRFPERYQDGSLARYIHEKYANQKFDLLIALGPRAVDFLRSERDSLAPGVPIIFAGVGTGASTARGVNVPHHAENCFAGWLWALHLAIGSSRLPQRADIWEECHDQVSRSEICRIFFRSI
jgi:hypothetical protein